MSTSADPAASSGFASEPYSSIDDRGGAGPRALRRELAGPAGAGLEAELVSRLERDGVDLGQRLPGRRRRHAIIAVVAGCGVQVVGAAADAGAGVGSAASASAVAAAAAGPAGTTTVAGAAAAVPALPARPRPVLPALAPA